MMMMDIRVGMGMVKQRMMLRCPRHLMEFLAQFYIHLMDVMSLMQSNHLIIVAIHEVDLMDEMVNHAHDMLRVLHYHLMMMLHLRLILTIIIHPTHSTHHFSIIMAASIVLR
jgi:hypothetical protein